MCDIEIIAKLRVVFASISIDISSVKEEYLRCNKNYKIKNHSNLNNFKGFQMQML